MINGSQFTFEQVPLDTVPMTDVQANVQVDHENKRVYVQPQKELTEGELKKIRKAYVTKQHPQVIACGHSLDLDRQPTQRNCEHCWFAWFNNHGEVVQQLDEMYTSGKTDEIIILQGIKFYKMWRKFMATIAGWQRVAEVNEQGISSTEGSNEGRTEGNDTSPND